MLFYDRLNDLWKSKTISRSFEHFLAMFPATVLVPITINATKNFEVINVSLVLFTSGLGTIIFFLFTYFWFKERTIPAYLGSSFAFIGMTVYLLETVTYDYIVCAYILSGLFLIILSLLFKLEKAKKYFDFFLPAAVIGPAISLIGLDLANSAVIDAGFMPKGTASFEHSPDKLQLSNKNSMYVAATTLSIIILMTITRRRSFKNSAIVLGMFGGLFLSILLCENRATLSMFDAEIFNKVRFSSPFLHFPPDLFQHLPQLFIAVIPATLVVFTENISRVTVISRMTDNSSDGSIFSPKNLPKFNAATFSHGIATAVAACCGSVPNTLYAENIAVMGTNRDKFDDTRGEKCEDNFGKACYNSFSHFPYIIAAILAIMASLSGHLQQFLMNVPTPVLGGVKLFLFGIIAAPGIQLLVEQRVNYKKISNQLLTASVLISGISGVKIPLGGVLDLQGMSLGFIVGILVNLLIKALDRIGRLNDNIEMEELFLSCVKVMPKGMFLQNVDTRECHISVNEIKELFSEQDGRKSISIATDSLSAEMLNSMVSQSSYIKFVYESDDETAFRLEKGDYALFVYFAKKFFDNPKNFERKYSNDKDKAVVLMEKEIQIQIGANVPLRVIQKYLAKLQRQ